MMKIIKIICKNKVYLCEEKHFRFGFGHIFRLSGG